MVDVRPFAAIRYNAEQLGSDLTALVCPRFRAPWRRHDHVGGERQSSRAVAASLELRATRKPNSEGGLERARFDASGPHCSVGPDGIEWWNVRRYCVARLSPLDHPVTRRWPGACPRESGVPAIVSHPGGSQPSRSGTTLPAIAGDAVALVGRNAFLVVEDSPGTAETRSNAGAGSSTPARSLLAQADDRSRVRRHSLSTAHLPSRG